MGVLKTGGLLFGVYIRAPDFRKLLTKIYFDLAFETL